MAKQAHPKGFTLIEMLLVFMMMTGLSLFMIPIGLDAGKSDKQFLLSSLIQTQFMALKQHQHMIFEDMSVHSTYPIVFTGKGMTNQAQTISLDKNGVLVILLGPGRIHE